MTDLLAIYPPKMPHSRPQDLPPDSAAREQALDVERSWIVEAPAGSGKTGLLIQRYLKLLGHESVTEPEQVLAITFTVKATSEMRERVMEKLEAAAQNKPIDDNSTFERETRLLAQRVLERDYQFDWKLLATPLRLKIRTIDSVCAEIARLLPVLSGGGGRGKPVDDPLPMYREAARRTLLQLGGPDLQLDEALRTLLLHRDGNLSNCEALLIEMLPLRNQWGELIPLGRDLDDDVLENEIRPQLEDVLEEAVSAGLSVFSQAVPQDFLERLCALASEFSELEPYGGVASPLAVCASKVGLPANSAKDLEYWRALIHLLVTPSTRTWRRSFARNHIKMVLNDAQKSALQTIIDEISHRDDLLLAIEHVNQLPPAVYPAEQWRVAKALFRVLSRALAELQVVFAQSGECDFTELGILARTALEREGAVEDLNAALGMRLEHLLVDEMQDTSTSQYRLIELLTQGWDGHSQTIFLVGDPKQSIYLFRQARVERFVRTLRSGKLGDLPLRTIQLTANFRSQRVLVEAFNNAFSQLFPHTAVTDDEVPYVEAEAIRDASDSASEVWHAHVLEPQDSIEAKHLERRRQMSREACEVRAVVEHWLAKPLPTGRTKPWTIAVLVRSRNLLGEIVAEFKNEAKGAIPYRAVDIEALGERQEVLDLVSLTRALLHLADRTAWLAVLRAPWCGLGLSELHQLAGGDDLAWAEKTILQSISERGDLLSPESCARLATVWEVMQAAQSHHTSPSISHLVERVWRSLGGDSYLHDSEMNNALRYFELLDEIEAQTGRVDLGLLEHKLRLLYAKPDESECAVDITTIHKAKGLEWDVVIVPGLEKNGQISRGRLLDWDEVAVGDGVGIMLAPIAGTGEPSKELNGWLRSIAKAREKAEQKRLFYVVCTRAREELHLFGTPERRADGEVRPAAGSMLETAWPMAQAHFAEIVPKQSTSGENNVVQMVRHVEPTRVNLAASAEIIDTARRPAISRRLPLEFQVFVRHPQKLGDLDDPYASPIRFKRPEGSVEARSFGNTVHTFIELMAQRLAEDQSLDELRSEIESWSSRIKAVLRADGVSPTVVELQTPRVKTALNNMLRDPEGIWILQSRNRAESEVALTSWTDHRNSVRLDRIFLGGAKPLEPGSDFLWIIDYKTTTPGRGSLDEFLEGERRKYAPQMATYAETMRGGGSKLRLGLYYPMLPRLVWWEPE